LLEKKNILLSNHNKKIINKKLKKMNSGVPRTILHWLQSLDLIFPYKYPKRDLADGRLAAEIFNHYYNNQINIDMLYSSPSFKHREDNWKQLQKFFNKHNINVPESVILPVLNCYEEGAIDFLKYIYTLLTNKKIIEVKREDKELNIPHYAIPTASRVKKCVNGDQIDMSKFVKKHNEFTKKLKEASISVNNLKSKSDENKPKNEEIKIKSVKVFQRS